jgi:hypothetical protein
MVQALLFRHPLNEDDDAWEGDPEFKDDDDPEYQEELFETCKHLGWKPSDLLDKAFAVKYKEWLARQPK